MSLKIAEIRLSAQGVKILKSFHLLFVMMWVVGVVAMALLYFLKPHSGDELYMVFKVMRLVDDALVIPGAILSVITGLIYGACTNWGFFKHKWIVVKWVISIAAILAGTFLFSPWLNICLEAADKTRDVALSDYSILQYSKMIFVSAVLQAVAIIFLVFVSVFKPWKKKK